MSKDIEIDRLLDNLCDQFEENWRNDAENRFQSFLNQVDSIYRDRLLLMLVEVDVDLRVADGQAVDPQDYSRYGANVIEQVEKQLHAADQTLPPNPNLGKDIESENESAKQIGPYKLLQQIGEGGMGSVWMAEQEKPVRRRVALKLIRADMGSKEVVARFEAERQALAMMNHQNIAKILDAGTSEQGNPYFVMELVKGIPITKYCDDHKLGITERLRLFMDVCAGVQHAHQKGIIHRDLKPGNILVAVEDGKPVAKVIDFGLAKAMESTQRLTDQSLFTGIGQVLGTLKYMSPEQASMDNLDIDTRTDIFALGVILYELLTGSTPLDDSSIKGEAILRILEIIREKDPVRPSSKLGSSTDEQISTIIGQRRIDAARLNRVLSGDLDWIVMKALEKDRTRRYESASGFAADIDRYLNDEPVEARPPTAGYRLRKFIRKHRAGVIATSLVAVALVGGIVGTTLGMLRAFKAEETAENRRKQAETALKRETAALKSESIQKQIATQKQEEAEKNLAYARKGNKILGSVFSSLNPESEFANISDLRSALLTNLDEATTDLGSLQSKDSIEVAEIQHTLGRSFNGLKDPRNAIKVLNEALGTYQKILGNENPETILCLNSLGNSYRLAGQFTKAMDTFQQALKLSKSQFGEEDDRTLTLLNGLAVSLGELGKEKEALEILRKNFEASKNTLGHDNEVTLGRMHNFATALGRLHEFKEAFRLFEDLRRLSVDKLGEDHPDTLRAMHSQATCLHEAQAFEKAIPIFEKVFELRKIRFGRDHPVTLITMNNLASSYKALGKTEKAIALHEQTVEIFRSKLGTEHPQTLSAMNNLGASYWRAGQYDKAAKIFEQCLPALENALGRNNYNTQMTVLNLGINYYELGRLDEAIPLLEEAYQFSEKDKRLAWSRDPLRDAYIKAKKVEPFKKIANQELDESRIRYEAEPIRFSGVLVRLGTGFLNIGDTQSANKLLTECYDIRLKELPDSWLTYNTQTLLGQSLLELGDKDKATKHLVSGYQGLKKSINSIPESVRAIRMQEAIKRVIKLYKVLDDPAEVEKYESELQSLKEIE